MEFFNCRKLRFVFCCNLSFYFFCFSGVVKGELNVVKIVYYDGGMRFNIYCNVLSFLVFVGSEFNNFMVSSMEFCCCFF